MDAAALQPRGPAAQPQSARAQGRFFGHVRGILARLAARASVRVFAVEGLDPPGAIDQLRLVRGIDLVDTPRSATVLLVAGRIPPPMHQAVMHAHDAMAHPRAVLQWLRQESPLDTAPFPDARVVEDGDADGDAVPALAAAIHAVQESLVRGEAASTAALLPDVDPAPWRGVGPYGQGGTGMTGGVPYGRPMTGRAPDRDGLELDQLPLRVGPFFAPFPAGLVLDMKLQGDVVQEMMVPGNAFATSSAIHPTGYEAGHGPFHGAALHAVPIAELERARACHHLRWLAHALRVHGLAALGCRGLRLADAVASSGNFAGAIQEVRNLRQFLERSRSLGWATAGIGQLDSSRLGHHALGPVSRAAGVAVDARADDPAYRALGFEPRVQSQANRVGDARDRWRQRMDEIIQSMELAARAGDRRTGGPGVDIEGPQGTLARRSGDARKDPSAVLIEHLPDLLRGSEWGDMITAIVSLDLDLRAAAPFMSPLAAPARRESSSDAHAMPGMHDGMDHGGGNGAAAA